MNTNKKFVNFYSSKIKNKRDSTNSLSDDNYFIDLILENLNQNNYLNIYNKILKDYEEIVLEKILNSLLNGEIIDYKVEIIENINRNNQELVNNKIKDIISNKSTDILKKINQIFINVFNPFIIKSLFDLKSMNMILFLYTKTKNEETKKYIKDNIDQFDSDNKEELLSIIETYF